MVSTEQKLWAHRKALDRFRAENIELYFNTIIQSLTVEENQAKTIVSKDEEDQERRLALVDRLGLKHVLNFYGVNCQGQTTITIGLGFHRPKLILADELTSNLDDENCAAVLAKRS